MSFKKNIGRIIEKRTVGNLKKEITKHVTGKAVLDNGCGGGSFFYEKHLGKKIYGIDIRKVPNYQTNFRIANSTNLPFGEDYLDCVVFSGVIQYIKDYNKALLEIKRVLKNKGRFVFATLNKKSLLRLLRIINPSPKTNAGEFKIFSYRELVNLLNNHNFNIINEIGVDCVRIPKKLCSNVLFVCENKK